MGLAYADRHGMTNSRLLRTFAPLVLAGSLALGCTAEVRTTTRATPDLVAVGNGVYVIADYDEPIFYLDGFYWWFYDGRWFRSGSYTDGWVYVSAPPRVIVQIDRPIRFRHHRPATYVVNRRPAPIHTVRRPAPTGPTVRDHRR